MGLQRFKTFQTLIRNGHYPRKMGFVLKVGDINGYAHNTSAMIKKAMRSPGSPGGTDADS